MPKTWKEKVDEYFTKDYDKICKYVYKYAHKYNLIQYKEDIINELYLFLVNNQNHLIQLSKHTLYFLSNMHYNNNVIKQKYMNFNYTDLDNTQQLIDNNEIDDLYEEEYYKQKHKEYLAKFKTTLKTSLEISLFKLIYEQHYNTGYKLAKKLNISHTYGYKYLNNIKNKLEQWKKENNLT